MDPIDIQRRTNKRFGMELLNLLLQQLESQRVGTLTLGRTQRFREIFFDRDAAYLVGQELSGKLDLGALADHPETMKKVDLRAVEELAGQADLTLNALPSVLAENGIISDDEQDRLIVSHVREEILELLVDSSGSFHFQEGRVPEFLMESDSIQATVSVPVDELSNALKARAEQLSSARQMLPSGGEILVLADSGRTYLQQPGDRLLGRVLSEIDGKRTLGTIVEQSFLFPSLVLTYLADALERGFIKKTLIPELRNLRVDSMSKAEAEHYLPAFKAALKHTANELTARVQLALVYERLENTKDALVQYNFVGDAYVRRQEPAKAVAAYERALNLSPGETLLAEKVARIYVEAGKAGGPSRPHGRSRRAVREGAQDSPGRRLDRHTRRRAACTIPASCSDCELCRTRSPLPPSSRVSPRPL